MAGAALPAAILCFAGSLLFPAAVWSIARGRETSPGSAPPPKEQAADPCREIRKTAGWYERVFRRLSARGLAPENLTESPAPGVEEAFLRELDRRADSFHSATRLGEIYHLVPYLKRLLEVITRKTEESAFGLMEAYSSIQGKTADTARQGELILHAYGGEGKEGGMNDLVRDSLCQVDQEREVIGEMGACIRDMAEKMETLRNLVGESTEMLKQIGDITERSRLIGINLSIEASRIGGAAGQSFKVIVQALNRLNDQTTSFSGNIARRLADLQESFDGTRRDVEKTLRTAVARMEERSGVLKDSVKRLTASYETFSRISAVISESAIGVNADMDAILEHLQFQDITRQEAETVRDVLSYIEDCMKQSGDYFSLCGSPLERTRGMTEEITRRLLARAKVKDEREAIVEVSHEHSRG